MKNTGIEYLSTERKSHVLEELATLLPPLSEEQRSSLEADLLTNGCYSPIVVNEDKPTKQDMDRLRESCKSYLDVFREPVVPISKRTAKKAKSTRNGPAR